MVTSTTSSSFDASGFSAVANFFGKPTVAESTSSSRMTAPKSKGRLGVGATASKPSASQQSSNEATSKLMKIGRRKRKNQHDGDDEIDEEAEEEEDEEEDEGEEDGRTMIEEKAKPTVAVDDTDPVEDKPKKKKKKGKKERHAEALATADDEPVAAVADEHTTNVEAPNDDVEMRPSSSKRKRRKVRSRQKNIYKDSRPMDKKPKHLQLGDEEFEGRPLTAETRARLLLPARKERKRHITTSRPNNNNPNDGALAIDELLAEEVDDDGAGELVVKPSGEEPEKKSKPTKGSKTKKAARRKPKYKNLR